MSTETTKSLKQRVLNVIPLLPRYGYVPKVIAWLKENGYEALAKESNIAMKVYNVVGLRAENEAITQALEAITENK